MIKLNIINQNRGMGKERRTGNDHSVTGELSEERKGGEGEIGPAGLKFGFIHI